jgi:hypothetical protein
MAKPANRVLDAAAGREAGAAFASDGGEQLPADGSEPAERTDFPCSPAQERFWLLDRLDPGNSAYNVAVRWRLEGRVATDLLEQSWLRIIERHEVLRTVFLETDGAPIQRVMPRAPFRLNEIDLSNLSPELQQTEGDRIGVIGPNVLLAHCLGIDEGEVDCIARTGTAVAMCPVTAAKSGRGVPEHGRMPELLARGVRIALGCDSPNNSNHLDIVRAMNMAAIQYKDARQDLRQVPAEAALEMATLHGAQAMGLGDELGSIEAGKKADLVCFDTLRPEWQALWNPVNNLVYNADGRSVHTVVIDGRVVVDGYRQTFADEPRLYAKVQEIGERLQARTGITFPRSKWPMS